MKKVTKIVLTGGPCAGKTSAINLIKKVFTEKGYAVMHCAEVPTDLIMSGITPWGVENFFDFEDGVLNLQVEREAMIEKYAQKLKDVEKVLIICDRGIMDIKAYLPDPDFTKLLKQNGLNENDAMNRYDAIFHLVTAASGAKEFYTLENNVARSETVEVALELDKKTLSAWVGHSHLRIIDSSMDFDAKLNKLISEISSFLNESDRVEIEKKYLIEYPDIEKLEKEFPCKKISIEQKYLSVDGDREVRVRKRGINNNFSYFKTEKLNVNENVRLEKEEKISVSEYLSLLSIEDGVKANIKKDRYCFIHKNQYFELDIYPFWNDKAILEIELFNENDSVQLPEMLNVIKDVTGDVNYRNYHLAKFENK